eukprot:4123201-Alexandrium_andersonii.AAC.1
MARRPAEPSIMEQSPGARSWCVVFRDPRAKAVGGRAPWMEPLSDPRVVARAPGTCRFQRADGFATGGARVMEKVVRDRGADSCDQQCPGIRAGDAGGPAAREAS